MHLDIFTSERFNNGKWASKLKDELRNDRLRETLGLRDGIAGNWECHHRVWRGTIPYQQWLQYQPKDHQGPFFWSGKPAVMLSDQSLYSGYYVERGLPRGSERALDDNYFMDDGDPKWDWSRFYPRLTEECAGHFRDDGQTTITSILESLPEERRYIWLCDSTAGHPTLPRYPASGTPFSLRSMTALPDAMRAINAIERGHWVDVVAGVRYTQQECVDPQNQMGILEGIVNSLKTGHKLLTLCQRPVS